MALVFDPIAHRYTLDGAELPSVTHICRFLSYDDKSDRPWLAEAAARRGTAVHEACTLLDYGEEPEETPEIAGYLTAYRRFLKDYRPEWTWMEHPMGSLSLGYAGTLDRCGTLYDGRLCILDIKTGNPRAAALRAQLTAYAALARAEGLPGDVRLYGLKLGKDGIYFLQEVQPDPELLKACLFLHKTTERKKRPCKN